MKVIIGLGNPGKEYELTRHNVGFLMIDGLAKKLDVEVKSHNKAIEGLYYKCDDYILLKPICFMNNSGTCVRSLIDLFKLESFEILLIYDEIFIPLGSIRYGKKCSGGGHNGAKDVIWKLKKITNFEMIHLRIGVGYDRKKPIRDWVLSNFSNSDLDKIKDTEALVVESLLKFLEGAKSEELMNDFNGLRKHPKKSRLFDNQQNIKLK